MKKIVFITTIFIASSLTSCVDLDVTPSSSIDKNRFYQTEADAITAVNGIYAVLVADGFYGLYNNLSIYLGELTTDLVKAGANTNSAHIRELSNLNVQPTNAFVITAWQNSYIGINRANVLIDKLSEGADDIPSDTKNRLIREAAFLRALLYFNLVRWFGDVPLVLHEGEGEGEPRTPVDDVYAQIVKDLEEASVLPNDEARHTEGRPTGGAALATLSKVYLTWAQTNSPEGKTKSTEFYQKAVSYADEVIRLSKYRLLENVLDLFSADKKNGPEHIFSIQHANNNNVTGHCTFAMQWSDSEPVLIVNDVKFYEGIDDADQRKRGAFAKELWHPGTHSYFTFKVPLFRKYIDTVNYTVTNPNIGQNTNNVYIRYAEVLLIKAEALNELNGPVTEAYDAINQVRRRAYQQPLHAPSPYDLAGLSKEQFREKLQAERWLEFVLEGNYWFDLVRWRKLVQTIRKNTKETDLKHQNISAKHYLFPLPLEERILNPNLEQNWGYEGETGNNPYADYEPGYTNE
ncbi:MAG: RagB/SusD family nutrient uptake outer membrane protein [Tannerellaceae bacterium]|jgi:hypothetical protein|nr:RagB/SusD family nutrient uptake outer membrane protein [Tannerellaceae bacterium]